MIKLTKTTSTFLALLLTMNAQVSAGQEFTADEIKKLALEAILENPETIRQALVELDRVEARAKEERVRQNLQEIWAELSGGDAPILGNPDGNVTLVEFFDYNCPFCRRVKPEIEALKAADADIRYVYREWPILGEGSVFAAKAALASIKQGKYEEFHWALMSLDEPAEEISVIRVAMEIGLDIKQLQLDMAAPEIEQHIANSMRMARSLDITGTPTFVFRDKVVAGLVRADQLVEEVERLRADSN